jgi:hypothetical protein
MSSTEAPWLADVVCWGDWDGLSRGQRDSLVTLARSTLGWGLMWGREFSIRFFLRAADPSSLPAGIAVYNTQPSVLDELAGILGAARVAVILDGAGASERVAVAQQAGLALVLERPLQALGHARGFTTSQELVQEVFALLDEPRDAV